jgi:uncharacterized protein
MNILEKCKGLSILITGATSGIGLEFAKLLSKCDCSLVLVGRNREKLDAVKNELSRKGLSITLIQADLTDPASAEQVARNIESSGITIDALVNNAGVGLSGRNIDLEPDRAASLISINVTTLTNLSMIFAKKMSAQKKGYILNVGSLIAFFSLPFFSVYAASKAYVINYSRALRTELKDHGVSVTCLLPGFTKTNFDANAGIESPSYKGISRLIAMDPAKVAKSGLRAMFTRKSKCVPGMMNKLSLVFSQLLPKQLISAIAYRLLSPIMDKR